jgi:hypothetical protein
MLCTVQKIRQTYTRRKSVDLKRSLVVKDHTVYLSSVLSIGIKASSIVSAASNLS